VTISTLDGYLAAVRQRVAFFKSGTRTTVASAWYSIFDLAGNPGAGTLAGTSTAAGVVPDDTTAGCPLLNAFGGGATGYLTNVEYGWNVAGRLALHDLLFKAGAYSYNASQALSGQPSYSGRIPTVNAAADYTGTQIWVEQVTTGTGTQSVAVTYTNQAGTGSRSTGTVAAPVSAAPVGRMWQLPLQAGDSGVQKIDNVVGSVASGGTFNILVLRPLWTGRCRVVNDGDIHPLDRTGMPVVFATTAFYVAVATDSTSSAVPELLIEVANG
jgi:hypothetical protein